MSEFELPRREALKVGAGMVSIGLGALPAQETLAVRTLDAHQMATVEVLSELIIPTTDTPGAKAAGVPKYVDLFLTDGPGEQRVRFLEGLGWLDGYTNGKHGKPFVRLSEEQQVAVLTTLDRDLEVGVDEGTKFFRMAKNLVSRIYYNTETGYKELNKGGRVPSSYGCAVAPKLP